MVSYNSQQQQSQSTKERRSIEELINKYECASTFGTPSTKTGLARRKSFNSMEKHKVQKIASMFNNKMSQIVKREQNLFKECSTAAKQQTTQACTKPVAMPRTIFSKPKAPVPNPRSKTLAKNQQEPSACFVPENSCATLSVKHKALLYAQFLKEAAGDDSTSVNDEPNRNSFAENEPGREFQLKTETFKNKKQNAIHDQQRRKKLEEENNNAKTDKILEEAVVKLKIIEDEDQKLEKSIEKSAADAKLSEADEKEALPKTINEELPLPSLVADNNNTQTQKLLIKEHDSDIKSIATNCEVANKQDTHVTEFTPEPSETEVNLEELHQNLMKTVNSPRKIKSVYTLTINELETPVVTPRASIEPVLTAQDLPTPATGDIQTTIAYPKFNSSIPNKPGKQNSALTATSSAKRIFSPIAKLFGNHRSTLNEAEFPSNSLATQVIKEDQVLDSQVTSPSQMEQTFFANASIIENPTETGELLTQETSEFWINCKDFLVAFDINFIDKKTLCLLHEAISDASREANDYQFGIDNYKFSMHESCSYMIHTATWLHTLKGSSCYWFSTGNLAIPLSGKYLKPHKIQRVFQVIKETVQETGVLRFGVDDVEFSNNLEHWLQIPKLSTTSQQTAVSDYYLEEGRLSDWPHKKPVMITDLDQSDDNEQVDIFPQLTGDDFKNSTTKHYDLSTPASQMTSLDFFYDNYESVALNQLFDDNYFTQHHDNELEHKSVTSDGSSLSSHQQQFSKQETFLAKESLDFCKDTPEYVAKLKAITADIIKNSTSKNLKEYSLEELDSSMYFLNRYAELCFKAGINT